MILLHSISNGTFVFNPDDWTELRKQHRIIGEVIGGSTLIPKLPLKLCPEEVALLLELNLVKVIKRIQSNNKRDNDGVQAFDNFTQALLEEEKVVYKNIRRQQLENLKDTIIAAKRKKGDSRREEEILEEELQKSCQVTEENMIWPILNEPIISDMNQCQEVTMEEVLHETTNLKYMVFKDLWNQGYYITSGHKFGGHYLAYIGDPIAYHAVFIVRCIDDNTAMISPSEIVAFGRLATSVKKRAVLASFDADTKISYITINWIDA